MFRGLRYFQRHDNNIEDELKDATIYNLNLYIDFVKHNFPHEFNIMEDYFEGLPGYSETAERN